jgi:hypothetical protein
LHILLLIDSAILREAMLIDSGHSKQQTTSHSSLGLLVALEASQVGQRNFQARMDNKRIPIRDSFKEADFQSAERVNANCESMNKFHQSSLRLVEHVRSGRLPSRK